MPKYSPEIQYGCLTLTHFAHSQKLEEDGGRTLFNQDQYMIKWQDGDEEGKMIDELAPMQPDFPPRLPIEV